MGKIPIILTVLLTALLMLITNEKGQALEPDHPDLVSYKFIESEIYLTRIWVSLEGKEPRVIEAEFAKGSSEFIKKKKSDESIMKVFKYPLFSDGAIYLSHLPHKGWNHGNREDQLMREIKEKRHSDLRQKLWTWIMTKVPLDKFQETSRRDFFKRTSFFVFPTSDRFKLKCVLLESVWGGDSPSGKAKTHTHLIDLKL
jgi:hypothetical protein